MFNIYFDVFSVFVISSSHIFPRLSQSRDCRLTKGCSELQRTSKKCNVHLNTNGYLHSPRVYIVSFYATKALKKQFSQSASELNYTYASNRTPMQAYKQASKRMHARLLVRFLALAQQSTEYASKQASKQSSKQASKEVSGQASE